MTSTQWFGPVGDLLGTRSLRLMDVDDSFAGEYTCVVSVGLAGDNRTLSDTVTAVVQCEWETGFRTG